LFDGEEIDGVLKPKIEDLLKQVDSRYTLVILAAKRESKVNDYLGSLQRDGLAMGKGPLVKSNSNKPLSIALEEIAQGKIKYERTGEGIK